VHLSHAGHPIVGDKLYGLDEDYFLAYYEDRLDETMRAGLLLPRQALHAARIVLDHPRTGERLEVVAPLPEDLRAFLDTLDEIPGGSTHGAGELAR
jgi:23S rRNA pseudouridine1911/1915/1917 synthase